jgi:hypothetical protein
MTEHGEGDRTDLARVINLIPIERKKNTKGPFKTGSFANVSRVDITRGITETSREYVAEKTQTQLRGVAASAANTDISSIRDTVLHLESIMAKNTAARLDLVTNAIDAKEAAEDRLGKLGYTPGGAGLDTFGVLQLHPTKVGGATWFSTAWNANPRTISQGNSDPNDARFWSGSDNPSTTPIHITGDGTGLAYFNQANTGVWFGVNEAWLNTEMTLNVYIDESDNSTSEIWCISRATTGNCNFEGYLVKYNNPDKIVEFGAWPLENLMKITDDHPIESGLPRNQWIGLKFVVRTKVASSDIFLEVYINYNTSNQTMSAWTKLDENTIGDDEDIPDHWATEAASCATLGDGTADKIIANDQTVFTRLTVGNTNWWYILNLSKVWLRHCSIREIDPLP